MKKTLFLSLLLCLTACKDKNTQLCEQLISQQTYRYEEICKCIIKSANDNGVENFEDIIKFTNNRDNGKLALKSILANDVAGAKTKKILNALSDIDTFCDIASDIPFEKRMYLIDDDRKFVFQIDNYTLPLSLNFDTTEGKEFSEKHLYQGDTIIGLIDFLKRKVKNREIKSMLENIDPQIIIFLSDFDKNIKHSKFDKHLRNSKFVLGFYDNDFTMLYFYFIKSKKYPYQEALDHAYAQAFLALMWKISNVELLDPYIDSMNSFYKQHKDKAIFISTRRKKQGISLINYF